jgi:hypothetical protein
MCGELPRRMCDGRKIGAAGVQSQRLQREQQQVLAMVLGASGGTGRAVVVTEWSSVPAGLIDGQNIRNCEGGTPGEAEPQSLLPHRECF